MSLRDHADHVHAPRFLGVPVVAWLTLLVSLAITVLVWYSVKSSTEQAAGDTFHRLAHEVEGAIEQRLLAYEQVLRGGAGLFKASDHVTRAEWHRYIATIKIEDNFPGIQGIGFSKIVKPEDLARHVAEIRAAGFPDYQIKPPGVRDVYTSIIYLEPFDRRNQAAFGYDMFSEPTRHAAMVMARDSGETVVSGRVILKQEITKDVQNGFLMYLPFYRRDMVTDTVEQRRAAIVGYVYSPFRMNNFMHGILGGEKADLDLRVYDAAEPEPSKLMYQSRDSAATDGGRFVPSFHDRIKLDIQGHDWLLEVRTTPAYEQRIDRSKRRIVLSAGLAISLLFTGLVWLLATRRERAQELAEAMTVTVREREAFIRAILDSAADGIITIDEAGTILSLNRAAETIFGYAANELLGRNVSMLMPEPYRSEYDRYLANYLRSGEKKIIGIGREVSGLRKNGEIFPLDLAVSEVDQEGHRVFAGIVRDITERKRAELALRESEERFDLALRGANDGLWDWNLYTNEVYFSPRWKEMLGYAEDEIGNSVDEWSSRVHPDDLDRALASVRDHLEGRTPLYTCEHRVRHKDGHYLWILDRGIAQRDAQGKPYRMVGIHTDISERKQMEKMKSEFVSTVSHELRTPLTAIRGSLGLISGGAVGQLPEPAKGLIDMAMANTERLLALINDLLDMDKIQSGAMQFDMQAMDIVPLVEQSLQANQAYADQYQVVYVLAERPIQAMAKVDPARFTQVMSNLLSNAAKFSKPGGQVEVRVTIGTDTVRVAVVDHGVGIPQNARERIFQKFSQVDSSDTRHKGGTGLGLSISKSLIEKMNGQIGFESRPGEGATFYFTLPLNGGIH